nr:hypothetical protein [Enterobacter roggenkampii]
MMASTLNFWHSAFQLIAIVGAALALIGGAGTFWTGRLKERAASQTEQQLRDQIRSESEARKKLEKKTAGRRALAPAAQAAGLSAYRGQGYLLTSAAGDPEASRYAEDLQQRLREAGWKNLRGDEISQALWMGNVPDAFLRVGPDVQSVAQMPACTPLASLLTETGNASPIDMAHDLSTPPGAIQICIGPKRAV